MKCRHKFEGVGTALVTPFTSDYKVDYESLKVLVAHQLEGGADFLVIHGTTGESPCLKREEREEVTRRIVNQVAGRIPIVIGLGGNNTMELGERIAQLAPDGIDGVLSVVPYYNKPTQEGLVRHFSHLAECSPLPIILYNVPGRVGINMMPETIARLAQMHPNIVGVKEASGFVAQAEQCVKLVDREDFVVLSGDDNLTIPFMRNGARGVISVISNAYPRLFAHVVRLGLEGRYNEAEEIQAKLRDMNTLLFANGNPTGIKALLWEMGIIKYNCLRLPLLPATEEVFGGISQEHRKLSSLL